MPVHESHPHGAPCWADLLTTDADGARAFYGGLFGWSFDIAGAEYNHYTTCEKGGKTVVGLSAMPPGMPPMPPAWNVYFASVDVDASCAAIGAAGGTVAMPPMTVGEMGRMAGALDPSGAYFGMWQAMRHTGTQLLGEDGTVGWFESYSHNAAAARAFYETVFGLRSQAIPGMDYSTLHLGEGPGLGGIMQIDASFPAGMPSVWGVYFMVDSADAATARVKELGGTVMEGPIDTPYGRMVFAVDPQGAMFRLLQAPPMP